MDNDKIRSFEDLIVWQKADVLWRMICEDVDSFPNKRIAWIVTDQVVRSVGSISANIAEGYGSGYPKEFIHALKIARKEANESVNWLIKAQRLDYITSQRLEEYRSLVTEVLKMLNTLISKLSKSN